LSYDIAGRWTDRPLKRVEKVLVKFDWKVKGRDGEIVVRKVEVWNVAARTMEKTSWTADSLEVAKPGGLVAWSRFQAALKAWMVQLWSSSGRIRRSTWDRES